MMKRERGAPGLDELIHRAREIGADGLDLAEKGPVDREFVARVKEAGLELYVWTVDDPVEARRFVEAGVDGITTNKPSWLRTQLDAAGLTKRGEGKDQ
jgi:glycerophosphoryl diester phosphodiesterase